MSPDPAIPWRSERPLNEALVLDLAGRATPAAPPARAVAVASGWDCEVWRVDETWGWRFPRRAACEAWLDVERAALPSLAPRLPLPIPVPERLGERSEAFPWRHHGARWIEGVSADLASPAALDEGAAARALGGFLAALHAVPAAEALAWGAADGFPLVPLSARLRERERWIPVRPLASEALRARVDAWLDAEDPPLPPGPRLVSHGDLRDGNVVLDAAGRSVVAVIDWIDLSVVDPARDLGGLLAWRGEPFVREVIAAHGGLGRDVPALLARCRRRAAHLALAVAWQGALADRPPLLASGLRGLAFSVP